MSEKASLDMLEPRGYISRVITERKVFECYGAGKLLFFDYLIPKIKDMIKLLEREERNVEAIIVPLPPWAMGNIAMRDIIGMRQLLQTIRTNVEDSIAEYAFKRCIRKNLLSQPTEARTARWSPHARP